MSRRKIKRATEPAPAAPAAPPAGRASQGELDALHGVFIRKLTELLSKGEPTAAMLGVAARALAITDTRAGARELGEDRLMGLMPDFDAIEGIDRDAEPARAQQRRNDVQSDN